MKNYWFRFAALVALMLGIISALCLVDNLQLNHQKTQLQVKVDKYDGYCRMVRIAIEMDRDDLLNLREQDAAARRFSGEEIAQHSVDEIELCAVDYKVDRAKRTQCWHANDYACLSAMAADIVKAIPRNLPAPTW